MTTLTSRRDDLGSLIFDMEDKVANMARWASAIRDLGTTDNHVDPEGLYVIGIAMIKDGEALKADWARCFELSRNLREGGR